MSEKKTIDITPTWMGLYPLFEDYILNGSEKQKKYVCKELEKLCKVVDEVNAKNKERD